MNIKILSMQVKIQIKTFIKYISIVKELQARNTDFHTYKMKDERSFKVVLKMYTHLFRIIKTRYK